MRSTSAILWLAVASAGLILLLLSRGGSPSAPAQKVRSDSSQKSPAVESSSRGEASSSRGDEPKALHVLVKNTGGEPLAGAQIELLRRKPKRWITISGVALPRTDFEAVWNGRTAKTGGVSIPYPQAGGLYFLRCSAPGYPPCLWPLDRRSAREGHLLLEVARGGTLSAFGLPGAGIPVLLLGRNGLLRLSESDTEGKALFEDLPQGSYALFIGDPQIRGIMEIDAATQREQQVAFPYKVIEGKVTSVDLRPVVSGMATLEGGIQGAPADIEVTLRSSSSSAFVPRTHRLGREGRFRFRFLPPGSYQLVVTPALGEAHVLEVDLSPGDHRELSLALPLAALEGVVFKSDRNKPAAGVSVAVQPLRGTGILRAVTASDGTFRFAGLLPGGYRVTVETPESGTAGSKELHLESGKAQVRIDIGQ